MFWIQFEFWTKALFNMIFTVGLAKFFTILGLIYALHTDVNRKPYRCKQCLKDNR